MSSEAGAGFAILFTFLFIFLFVFIIIGAVYVITSIIYKKILEKDGRNGWLGFIPVYRDYLLIEMSDLNWYWILVILGPTIVGMFASFIPFIGSLITAALSILSLVARINLYYNLSKKFKTEDWFIVLLALVPLIGLGVLAFSSKYEYHKEVEVQPDGFFGDLGIIKKETANNGTVAAPVVEKKEETKVTKEEIKETKKEEVKEAEVEPKEENPKKTTKKTNNKKKED